MNAETNEGLQVFVETPACFVPVYDFSALQSGAKSAAREQAEIWSAAQDELFAYKHDIQTGQVPRPDGFNEQEVLAEYAEQNLAKAHFLANGLFVSWKD